MTTPTLDLKKLSLKDALDLAVLIEEEARDCYVELAEQLRLHHTPAAAAFFEKMSRVEELHRTHLLEQRQRQFGEAAMEVSRDMIFDVESPGFADVRDQMTLREALEIALHAEEKAKAFFDEALQHVTDPQVRTLFAELCAEEVEHRRLVLAELSRVPPELPFSPTAFEDDPVPQ